MAPLVTLLLFAFFVNQAQAECSQSASLSVFLLQSSSPIEADEITNLTDMNNGLGYEEDESCCLYYKEDDEGNDVNVTACRSKDIDIALGAINTTEYYHQVLVLGKKGTTSNYTLQNIWNTTGENDDYYYSEKSSMTLIGRGSPTIKFSKIFLNFINTVSIINVSFVEGMITLTDNQEIQLTSVTIRNSTGLLITKKSTSYGRVTISDCHFIQNRYNTNSFQGGGLNIDGSISSYKIVIEDSQFTNNEALNGGGLSINVQFIENLTISGCSFTNNSVQRDGGGLWINAAYNDEFNIINTDFTNNRASKNGGGAHILIQKALSSNQKIIGSFYNVHWVSNTAPLSPAMKLIAHDSGKLSSNISNNTFKWNSSPKQYLSGSTACSLYSDGFNIILEGTNFISNKAAGACAKNAIISVPTDALFYSNTAYKGAGIYLDDDSYLELGPHSYLNFTRNSAVYGAGIYQKTVTNEICFLNKTQNGTSPDPILFFQDNIATISGKAIFFNDPDQHQCKLELGSLKIKYDDDDSRDQQITSSAINISFSDNIEDNEITLILGQRLILNASVTDIFDNETFALVSIFLLPPDSSLFDNINYNLAHETTFTIESGRNYINIV